MGEWENLEIDRLSRLAESLGWSLVMTELVADKMNIKLEKKVPLEILRLREEMKLKEGLPL